MLIRTRVALIIVVISIIIVMFAIFAGITFTQRGIDEAQKAELTLISDIADHFLSSEIDVLKWKATFTAQELSINEIGQWHEILEDASNRYPEFIGFAVFEYGDGVTAASLGEWAADISVLDDDYIIQTIGGSTMISSTVYVRGYGAVFYLGAPVPDTNAVLVTTVCGTHFGYLLENFIIWETGHVFMSDAHGYAISNPRRHWIQQRYNYISDSKEVYGFEDLAQTVTRMISGETGIALYTVYGVPRLGAFRPISGSVEGWSLGAVAPLPESPFRNIDSAMIVWGIVSVFLSIVAAVIASGYIKKPFEVVAALREAAEENSKYKSEFIAGMSHEIRTPMNVIMGVTEILTQNEVHNEKVSDGLNKIYHSGDMLLGIINDILDLSKIEAGKLELVIDNYDTASVINDTVAPNMMKSGSKPIEFKLSVDENLPATLRGDELRIKQILNNLLSNAFKYTDEGEVKLGFNIEKSGDDAFILELTVSDTGRGMTEDEIDALYDRYTRFNYEANRTTEGTGLGMNITQNLVDLMNGSIHVESEIRKGTVFTVRLPQGYVDDVVLGKEVAERLENFNLVGVWQIKKAQITHEPMPYGKILVVDDAESNLFVTKGLLAPYHLKVETAISGFQAIDKINEGKEYDIILMDHMMPKMDGIETVRRIRESGYTLPIVALTANAVSGQAKRFMENGFDDFISKPIDVRYLNTVLKKYVRNKNPEENIMHENAHQLPDAAPSVNAQLAEFFIRDAVKAIEVMEPENREIDQYTIGAHTMKSALLNVGEPELSATAAKLEKAGTANDITLIENETAGFIAQLRELITRLTPPETHCGEAELSDSDYEYLSAKLTAIKNACGIYDKKTAKAILAELRNMVWSADIKSMLDGISENLLGGDFGAIANAIDTFITSRIVE